jgi:hypothetical protein
LELLHDVSGLLCCRCDRIAHRSNLEGSRHEIAQRAIGTQMTSAHPAASDKPYR